MDEPTESRPPPAPDGAPEAPPTLPSRTAFLLAFASILVAGVFGGIIGYGLGDISVDGRGGLEPLLWAAFGALVAGGGVAVVAVLVLRAQAEWRRIPPPAERDDGPGRSPDPGAERRPGAETPDAATGYEEPDPSSTRRNDSA